jgi:hypothetical protein
MAGGSFDGSSTIPLFQDGPPFLSTKEAIARVKNSAYQQFSTIV